MEKAEVLLPVHSLSLRDEDTHTHTHTAAAPLRDALAFFSLPPCAHAWYRLRDMK